MVASKRLHICLLNRLQKLGKEYQQRGIHYHTFRYYTHLFLLGSCTTYVSIQCEGSEPPSNDSLLLGLPVPIDKPYPESVFIVFRTRLRFTADQFDPLFRRDIVALGLSPSATHQMLPLGTPGDLDSETRNGSGHGATGFFPYYFK